MEWDQVQYSLFPAKDKIGFFRTVLINLSKMLKVAIMEMTLALNVKVLIQEITIYFTLAHIYIFFFLLTVDCVHGALRLAGSSVSHRGRVEVCQNNTWKIFCSNFWGINETIVICRQLGYSANGGFMNMHIISSIIIVCLF